VRLACAAGLVLILVVASCGDGPSAEGPEIDLTIADLLPLSGDLEDLGPAGEKAAELAEGRISEAIDETGANHQVELLNENSETDSEAAERKARRAVQDGAGCIAGPWTTTEAEQVGRDVAIPREVPLISPAAGGDSLSRIDDDGLINRTIPPDSEQGPALAKAISGSLASEEEGEQPADKQSAAEGITANVAGRNDSYGTDIADSFLLAWQSRGGDIGAQVIYDPLGTDSSRASSITTGSPSAIVIADDPQGFLSLGPALEASGNWDPAQGWGSDRLAVGPSLAEEVGPEVIEGLRGTVPGPPEDWSPATAFDELYKGSDPRDVPRAPFEAHTFDAVVLCYLAAVAAGSTDGPAMARELEEITGPGGTEYSWEQLPEAIEALSEGEDIDYLGASGPIDLDDNGDVASGVYDVYRYEEGDARIIGEVEFGKDD
jgi:ABC-type branched-subunit amino acid transport system substrate-binding protein